MANAYFYSNAAVQTTLSGSVSGAAASIVVGATTGFPPSFPYVLALDFGAATEELVVVTAAGGTTLTVTRGFSGTSAQSHSLGAVVRHVYNAQDATDFRTHEAATTNVHGVTGAFVGTTQTQTLTNKTLTSPTINAAALSGTFTGSPTFSGTPIFGGATLNGTYGGTPTFSGNTAFSGEIAHSNLYRGTRALASDSQLETRVTGNANARWFIQADGRQWWGSGSALADTTLYRSAADELTTEDLFRVVRTNATDAALSLRVGAESNPRWYSTANGVMNWGPGGAAASDTILYRNGAGILRTDGAMQIGGKVTASNIRAGRDQTPAPGGSGGTSTVSLLFSTPMTSTPRVTIAPDTTVDPGAVNIQGYVDNVSTTGFTIRCFRSTASATNWMWIAVVE